MSPVLRKSISRIIRSVTVRTHVSVSNFADPFFESHGCGNGNPSLRRIAFVWANDVATITSARDCQHALSRAELSLVACVA